MLPVLVPEDAIHPFKFYFRDTVQLGMRHHYQLYRLTHTFSTSQRFYAYQLACRLERQGETSVVVTASEEHYRLWVCLWSSATLPEAHPDR
ncbi:hypothetical protein DO97_08500 [Neosynechococcus sphagnicola sy1]|uniref:Uncharacterized protein n=1 Tax=Neosynechococcus sphagnicola sy1 TaxID=1497020 RepID=A0A098TJK0_9CYAN|nr:hypothetical protein [Neosynechococcus sphagnicola]KGF72419.1 hypothetical protein DO97_08500 [Neosynechococcus sphagnicola sy1]